MSLVESEAAFFQRCDELAPGLKGLLEAKSIRTFRKLAFAIGTPQSAPSETDFQAFAAEVYSTVLRLLRSLISGLCILRPLLSSLPCSRSMLVTPKALMAARQ